MRGSFLLSLILHVMIVVVAIVGLPFFSFEEPEPQETAIVMDLVEVSERATSSGATQKADKPTEEPPRPQVEQKTPPKPEAAPKPEPKTPPREAPKPEPPKPQTSKPEPTPPPQPAKPEPAKPEPPKPQPAKPEPVKPEPTPAPEAPPEQQPIPEKEQQTASIPRPASKPEAPQRPVEQKPEPAKPAETKPEKKPEQADPFQDLMRNVEEFRKPASAPPQSQQPENPAQQQAAGGQRVMNAPVTGQATASELDLIRQQIEQNWIFDSGALGLQDMEIKIQFNIRPNGEVYNVRLRPESMARYNRDPAYRAIADSAIRAALKSSPIRYPQDKFKIFETISLSFTPRSRL